MLGSCFALALALMAWGCAGRASKATPVSADQGAHPAGWMQNHWAEFAKHPDQCRTCHGSTSDPAQAGGISKVSCFKCHVNGVEHPSGWAAPSQHGRTGAMAAPSSDPFTMAGFARCAKCHGAEYAGGPASSCTACHTRAPHPNAPWNGGTPSGTNHDATNPGNAPECFKCHAAGANSTLKPATPPPAGTAPGCFNNTMCHARFGL